MSRRTIAWGVLALWVAGLAWLGARTVKNRSRAPEAMPVVINPGAAFLALELDSVQVGVVSTTVDTLGFGIVVQDVLLLDTPSPSGRERLTVRTTASLAPSLTLGRFTTLVGGDVPSLEVRGEMDGDSLLRLVLLAGRDSTPLRQPVSGNPVLAQHIPLLLGLRPYREGDSIVLNVIDPFAVRPAAVRAVAGPESTFVVPDSAATDPSGRWVAARWDTVPARRFDLEGPNVPRTMWVGPEGTVVHALLPSGAIARRRAYEMAYENYRRRPPASSPFGVLGSIDPLTPPAATAGDSAVFVVDSATAALAAESPWQQRRGDTVTVWRAGVARATVGPVPTGSRGWALAGTEDPRMLAQARQIGSVRDRLAAARSLVVWVHGTLEKERGGVLAAAPSVLEARRGGVNEHVILFVGLAEAIGLPARPVAGVVATPRGLFAHAWAEVWLGEWVPVDPTLGQMPADVAHLRLGVGRLAGPVEFLNLIGAAGGRGS